MPLDDGKEPLPLKHRIPLSLWLGLLCCVCCALSVFPAQAEGGLLRTRDTDIVNDAGEVVQLRGVNAGGWLVQESWMCLTNAPSQLEAFAVLDERFGEATRRRLFDVYEANYWREQDFDNIAALGMNVIRVPFGWWNLTDAEGALLDNAFDRLDWFVGECARRNIYVVLDLHGAPGSQNGADHSGDVTGAHLWEDARYQDRTQALWEAVAAHFRGNPTIAAYDLLNEPGAALTVTAVTQWDFYDRLYRAVRAVDPEHIVILESGWGPEDLPAPDRYGWENVVYEYHHYRYNAENNAAAQKLALDMKLLDIRQAAHPVPTFIGDFSMFQSLDAWRYALDAFRENGLSWALWTYKTAGMSSRALYTYSGPKVDVYRDAAEEIEAKWRDQGTPQRSEALCQLLAQRLTGKELPPEETADAVPVDGPVRDLDVSLAHAAIGATLAAQEDGLLLTTAASLNPKSDANAIALPLPEPVDASPYRYLVFLVKDMQGSNTHRVTLIDGRGKVVSRWVDIPSIHNEWTRINVPLSLFAGCDLKTLSEVRVGEWNGGDYLFGRFFLSMTITDE